MKKMFALVAVLLVLTAFGMTILVHAGELSVPNTVPEVSTDYEVPVDLDTTAEPLTGINQLKLSSTSLQMIYKKTAKLTANDDVKWSSSNARIVKVTQDGTLTAMSKGSATVTATAADGRTAKCTVTVKYTFVQMLIRILLFGWIWH